MLDPLGPLALRWRYLPSLMPWLLRFLASRPSKVALTRDLSALLGRVNTDYATLINQAGLEAMWRRHGNLTLYRNQQEFDAALPAWQEKRRHGVQWQALSRSSYWNKNRCWPRNGNTRYGCRTGRMWTTPTPSAVACSMPSSVPVAVCAG
jgi:hypothetical protein